jgi:FtsP/CotA-like multicopper oxidase with cupredoxin domain
MNRSMDRRAFFLNSAGLAAAAGAACLPLSWSRALAATVTTLTIDRRTIEVMGKAASVFGIRQPDDTSGITLDPGDLFRVDLVNGVDEDAIIHWHGQRPPYLQDGVADANVALIGGASSRTYDYAPTSGTHWMHSHHGLQEQALMAAPLVVRSDDDVKADVQEVTILLHDFSFRDPVEILTGLTGGAALGGHDMKGMSGVGDTGGMAGMDHLGMKMDMGSGASSGDGMTMAMPDLNDVAYDAFLANDRTLDDPLVARVERGGRVRLRLINGAASSAFWIDLGALGGTLVAVDGTPVIPVAGSRFPMTMAQRLDVMVDVPAGGAFPVFAQVEGKRDRTGFILATPGARVEAVSGLAASEAPPVDLSLEMKLRASNPLAERPADTVLALALTGAMSPYVWSINDQTWPNVDRPVIKKGQRVVIEMRNRTMMAHPMHLHGHHFQVIELGGAALAGAMRDTVLVPARGVVKIAFDADNPGRWPLHCHNLYHMATGMMTELVYDTFA